MNNDYLTSQILTYMGNKRKFLPIIGQIINSVEEELGKKLNTSLKELAQSILIEVIAKTTERLLLLKDKNLL